MKKKRHIDVGVFWPLVAVAANLLLAYVVYFVARVAYLAENYSYFSPAISAMVLDTFSSL